MAASTDEVGTAEYADLEAAVYKKTMELIGEDATLKVCAQFKPLSVAFPGIEYHSQEFR